MSQAAVESALVGPMTMSDLRDLFRFFCHRRRGTVVQLGLTDNVIGRSRRLHIGGNVETMTSKGFQEFVKKAPGLLTPHVTVEVCNQIYLECLSYSQAKHQWEINFNQFLDALILLAERRHPWEKNRVQALIQNNIQPLWEVLFVSEDEPDAVSVRSGTSQRSTLTKVGPVKAGAAAIAAQSGLLGKGARRRSVLRTSSSGSMSRSRSMPPQNNGLTPVGEEDTELADVVDEEVKEEGETMDLKPAPRSRPAISERKIQAVPNGVSPELVEKLKAQNDQLVATIKDLIGAVKKLQGENQELREKLKAT